MYHGACVAVRGQLWESALCYHVGPGDGSQVIGFGGKYFCPLIRLPGSMGTCDF